MSLGCAVRGVGEKPLAGSNWQAVASWLKKLSDEFDWDCEQFQLYRVPGGEATRVAIFTKLQQSEETDWDRDLCQCIALAYQLSTRTPGWTWHVTDDIDCVDMSVGGALYIRDGETVSKTDAGEYVEAPAIEAKVKSYFRQGGVTFPSDGRSFERQGHL